MGDSSDAITNSTVAMSNNITSDQQTAMNQNGQLSGDVHFTQSENAQKPDIAPPREGAYCQPPISSSSSSVDQVNGEVHVDQSAQHKTKIPEGIVLFTLIYTCMPMVTNQHALHEIMNFVEHDNRMFRHIL